MCLRIYVYIYIYTYTHAIRGIRVYVPVTGVPVGVYGASYRST